MSMKDLVAVKRVDKRGRTVTRWVKPDSAAATRTSVPRPDALTSKTRVRLINRLASTIGVTTNMDGDRDDIETVRDELIRMDDRTLTIFKEALEHDNDDLAYTLSFAVREYSQREAREIAFFSGAFPEDADCQDRAELLNGLLSYTPFEGMKDLTKLDEGQHELASALLRVGYLLYHRDRSNTLTTRAVELNHRSRWVTDQSWVCLVEGNLGRVDDILDLIETRGGVDVETARAYLGNETALREGIL